MKATSAGLPFEQSDGGSRRSRAALLVLFAAALLMGSRGRAGEQDALLFDFESPKQAFQNAGQLEYVPGHATQGKRCGKIKLEKPFDPNFFFYGGSNRAGKWGDYNRFVIDVFVENAPVKAFGFVNDKKAKDWWSRHNFSFKLQPGKRQLSFSLGALTRQNGNGNLELKELNFFAIRFESEDPKHPATIYLDNARLVKGTGSFQTKVLFSFEGKDAGKTELEDWPPKFKGKSRLTVVREHASEGEKALRLESNAPAGNVQFGAFASNWSRYDSLAMDIFNPSGKPLSVSGWVRAKTPTAGWWGRFNYERMLKPGFNTLKLPIGGMTGPNGGKPIDVSKIVKFNVAVNRATIFLDNIRLIQGVEEVRVKGLRKFDFGPAHSAAMPGFTKVTRHDAFRREKGWGWLPGGRFGRDFDMNEMLGRHRPPDDLCRDFSQPTRATFAVNVPNGAYGVWVMLGPPGNGWGQSFKHRTLTANGKRVLDESYTTERFKAHEFRFQDAEDLPGDDLWEKYINVLFHPVRFEVEVTAGQLKLEFNSYGAGWAQMLNGLVLWPKAGTKDAERWLANFDALRKEQFQTLHVEKLPAAAAAPYAAGDEEKARGYVRFIYSPDREVQVNSVPKPKETGSESLNLRASPGEYEDACFGLYPLRDCGTLKLRVSDLVGPKGVAIPASRLQLRVVRYKALNKTSFYLIAPKYLDTVPAGGLAIQPGVTRSFWLTVHVPEDAPPGGYQGQVKLLWSGGKSETLSVALRVWPIKLAELKFPMSMFMMGPMQIYLGLEPKGKAYWRAWKEILEDARAHGMTSIDPLIQIPLKRVVNGKAEVDFSQGDRFMELAKAAGFTQELNGYSIGTGFRLKVGTNLDYQAQAKKFGVGRYAELVKAYFDAVRDHAKEKNWLPICFCTDDEYLVRPGSHPETLAAHHRLLQQNAPGFHFAAFDSAYGRKKPGFAAACDKMLTDIDTWGAGIHSPREAEVLRKAGRRLWLYNTGMNRFTFGTYLFWARKKYGVKGFFQWVYSGGGTYGNFYLASHQEAHYGVVYPSTHGLRATPLWERIRAGCDDHRYLKTAWRIIGKAKSAGKGTLAAQALQAVIEAAFAKLTFGKPRADALSGEGKADNPMSPAVMKAFRRALAEGILKTQKALP